MHDVPQYLSVPTIVFHTLSREYERLWDNLDYVSTQNADNNMDKKLSHKNYETNFKGILYLGLCSTCFQTCCTEDFT